jgi:hypothetical protein
MYLVLKRRLHFSKKLEISVRLENDVFSNTDGTEKYRVTQSLVSLPLCSS